MFSFTPKTEEELNANNLLTPGIANFEVVQAMQKVSKSGNSMIEMKLRIWDRNGKEKIIHDYLVDIPSMSYKIKHFCDSTEMSDKYEQGCFSDVDCIGKTGKLKIIISKDKTGGYPDKNSVADYLTTESKKEDAFHDDDIPF